MKLFKEISTPYVKYFTPEIPFNTVFNEDGRHFAFIGIGRSIGGYQSGGTGMYGYIIETNDS